LNAMDVEITQVGPRGEPMQAIFRFPKPLEDPSLVWLQWVPEKFAPFTGKYKIVQPATFLAK
ncbi:MAG TPA: hypothetical protein VFM46_01465, partial [Pseudomonadales bacterium]|nr:hypothetical protein [Pseudomonadales bacterium]